jgi:hypothetical protein
MELAYSTESRGRLAAPLFCLNKSQSQTVTSTSEDCNAVWESMQKAYTAKSFAFTRMFQNKRETDTQGRSLSQGYPS